MQLIDDVFLNWQVLLLSFAVGIVIGLVRKMGKNHYAKNKWFQTFLPVYPYALAIGIAMIPGVPLPDKIKATFAFKLLYAIYAGWLSDKAYQIVKHTISKHMPATETSDNQGS